MKGWDGPGMRNVVVVAAVVNVVVVLPVAAGVADGVNVDRENECMALVGEDNSSNKLRRW